MRWSLNYVHCGSGSQWRFGGDVVTGVGCRVLTVVEFTQHCG